MISILSKRYAIYHSPKKLDLFRKKRYKFTTRRGVAKVWNSRSKKGERLLRRGIIDNVANVYGFKSSPARHGKPRSF